MGIKEDSEEFNSSGWRGLVNDIRKEGAEGFIKIDDGGWNGERVGSPPEPGTGPYVHVAPGEGVKKFSNASEEDREWEFVGEL